MPSSALHVMTVLTPCFMPSSHLSSVPSWMLSLKPTYHPSLMPSAMPSLLLPSEASQKLSSVHS
eukprot:15343765-Ditylum_brightwellii.AAC.1